MQPHVQATKKQESKSACKTCKGAGNARFLVFATPKSCLRQKNDNSAGKAVIGLRFVELLVCGGKVVLFPKTKLKLQKSQCILKLYLEIHSKSQI